MGKMQIQFGSGKVNKMALKTVAFQYQEQLYINEWGTERIGARYINGKKYNAGGQEDLPDWLKQFIRRNLKQELVFTLVRETVEEHGNLSRPLGVHKFYMSQIVTIEGRTKNEEIGYFLGDVVGC